MADFYARMTEVATKLIEKRGQAAVHRALRQDSPDPDKPWETESSPPVDTNVVIAFLPVDRYAWETIRLRSGTDITEGHLTGYMAGPGPRPNQKDVILRSDKPSGEVRQLTIDDVVIINPDGRDVLYILLLRT